MEKIINTILPFSKEMQEQLTYRNYLYLHYNLILIQILPKYQYE